MESVTVIYEVKAGQDRVLRELKLSVSDAACLPSVFLAKAFLPLWNTYPVTDLGKPDGKDALMLLDPKKSWLRRESIPDRSVLSLI